MYSQQLRALNQSHQTAARGGFIQNTVSKDIGIRNYLKTRPDLVAPELSPIRTAIFTIIALAGLGFAIYVLTNAEDLIASFEGRRRASVSNISLYVLPPAIAIFGTIGMIWWSRRWRIPGGGKMQTAFMSGFNGVDPNEVWAALESAQSPSDPHLQDVLRRIHRNNTPPTGFDLTIMHSQQDQILVAAVTRSVLKNPNDPNGGMRAQLEREAVVRRGNAYIDFKVAGAEALKNI
ncbi:hypothetical protein V5R04_15285 [Jonesiaceae bacterium BS-20]|uniref:Uncharacterized protein n=1 Tax=Jonesiaceae bacterium BS-20 TaxID=3120821 RepID=A0AAU7DUQ3_9MICO